MITAIIFDLDGTLLNTIDDLHASASQALMSQGLTPCTLEETRRFVGNGVGKLIERSVYNVSPEASQELVDKTLAAFRAHYALHSMDRTAPYDGVMPLLHECHSRGYLTAIVSNKPDSAVKCLHRKFFSDCIDFAVGETSGVSRKPAPDMVEIAIRQLSSLSGRAITPSECVYVGDSEVDINTARNASLPCVSVSWGFRSRETLVSSGATTIIDSPQELLSHIL